MMQPLWPLPKHACDTHIHIYDLDAFPLDQTSPVSPPHVNWQDYEALRDELSIERTIIVQPMGYGFDNACTLDALQQSQGSARAVISAPSDNTPTALNALNDTGVVGIRFQMVPNSGNIMHWEELKPIAARIAPWAWTINLQLDGRELPNHEALLTDLPCPLVIDHVGKFLEPVSVDHPGFQTLRRLLDQGNTWVKLSAMYETSKTGAPDYGDVGVLAKTLAQQYPERCLWASNWPHPGQTDRPNDANLLALLDHWCASEEDRNRILVDNPERLYRF